MPPPSTDSARRRELEEERQRNVAEGEAELDSLKNKGYGALDIILRLGYRNDEFRHIVKLHGQWIMDAMGIDEPILACKRFIAEVLQSVKKINYITNGKRASLIAKSGEASRYFIVAIGKDAAEPKYACIKTAFVASVADRYDSDIAIYEGKDALELRIPMSSFGENQRLRVASEQHDRSSDYPVAAASVPSEGNVPQVGEVVKGESVEPRRMPSGGDTTLSVADAREHGEFDSDKDSLDITFNAVGEHAANWDELKGRAFKGRDDGKLRAEIDASQARLKKAPRHRMDSSVVDELVDRLRFFRDEVRRHGAWRRVEVEFGRGVVSDTVQEMVFLMRSVAAVGVDFGSYAELQESGMLELALNPTEEGARKLLRGREIEGVLGFNKLGSDANNAVITEVVSACSSDSAEKYKNLLKDGHLKYVDTERALMWASAEGDSVLQLLTTALSHSGS